MFDHFNFSISPVKDLIQHTPGHATSKSVQIPVPDSSAPTDTCLVLRLGWILEEYSIFWVEMGDMEMLTHAGVIHRVTASENALTDDLVPAC